MLKSATIAGRKKRNATGKRPLKRAVAGRKSVIKHTKNEPVVGRNNFHRARPCKGAKLAPWLWTVVPLPDTVSVFSGMRPHLRDGSIATTKKSFWSRVSKLKGISFPSKIRETRESVMEERVSEAF